MKVLVTGGGCEEPVDNVRSLCNFSTGKTSTFIADTLVKKGFDVTALMGNRSIKSNKARVLVYKSFMDLQNILIKELSTGEYDAIIHASAVSDYTPYMVILDGKEYEVGSVPKISNVEDLTIKLRKNPKLVESLKTWGGDKLKVIAFKLTSNASYEDRVKAVSKVHGADYVVSNDLSEITENKHPCKIFNNELKLCHQVEDLTGLASWITKSLGGA